MLEVASDPLPVCNTKGCFGTEWDRCCWKHPALKQLGMESPQQLGSHHQHVAHFCWISAGSLFAQGCIHSRRDRCLTSVSGYSSLYEGGSLVSLWPEVAGYACEQESSPQQLTSSSHSSMYHPSSRITSVLPAKGWLVVEDKDLSLLWEAQRAF